MLPLRMTAWEWNEHDRKLMAARTLPASRLRELKMPVLFITGAEDIVIPPPLVEALSTVVPGAKLEIVPEAGHSVYFERAERFNRVVDQFLTESLAVGAR